MKTLILIDGHSLMYRAFYALPQLTNTKGIVTNAIYGFLTMLYKLLEEENPTHLCVVFDAKGPSFRNEIYSEYKGTRKPTPEDLIPQFALIKEILDALGIKTIEKEGFEADDLIGTLSKKYEIYTKIVSGDRDVLQLISNSTEVILTQKGVSQTKKYSIKELKEEGFTPAQIIDYKALAGDTSDNIPGAPGIGDIRAKKILAEYNSVEKLFSLSEKIPGKLGETIRENKQIIKVSKDLATIKTDIKINYSLDYFKLDYKPSSRFNDYLDFLEMKSLVPRYSKLFSESHTINMDEEKLDELSPNRLNQNVDIKELSSSIAEKYLNKRVIPDLEYKVTEIISLDSLRSVIKDVLKAKKVAFFLDENLFFTYDGIITYKTNCRYSLFDYTYTLEDALVLFKEVLESKDIHKIGFDIKTLKHRLAKINISINLPYCDVQLKEYLLRSHFSYKNIKDLLGDSIASEQYPTYFFYLAQVQDSDLRELNLTSLYEEIERPLIDVLYNMECSGFTIDQKALMDLSQKYTEEIELIKLEVYNIAGREFNINSNKQLAEILFDELHIPPQGKTKGGRRSVDADVLHNIKHPIAKLLLRYRTAVKFLSTYIDGLRNLINKNTGKVHTVFQQCVTSTGRLSSTEPNLQNMPVRNDEGKEIRKILIASPGNILITADYSQIELRLVANFSEDETFINYYKENIDVHTATAAKMFGLSIPEVTADLRRKAKAINFGIIYGISAFGLAKNTETSISQAKKFMDKYFETHPKVHLYMESNALFARENYYIKTIFGRIRFFPEFIFGNNNEQQFAMRAAKNMPLQGSAADIIKKAMILASNSIKERSFKSQMILQVHDELIFDVPLDEVEEMSRLIKYCMEKAIDLYVPLTVDVKNGINWFEAS